jgi:NAD(P)-dependent dehydrogenase (short-subunit alcohol dehydrogenase family)
MRDFRDKVVVITGAASGIGRATARAFAREGARLHLVDIRAEPLEETAREIRELGRPVTTHVASCADAEAMEELARVVFDAEGRVDILHNNAGVVGGGPFEQTTLDDTRWVINTNLMGVVHGVHAFLPRMIAAGRGGHVINTASMAGLIGLPQVSAYCASKFGVVGLTEALAAELAAHHIGVTLVCPGMVRTNLLHAGRVAIPAYWMERLLRGWDSLGADPDEIAARTLHAVRGGRFLVAQGSQLYGLWLLKRASNSIYVGLFKTLTTAALRIAAALGPKR